MSYIRLRKRTFRFILAVACFAVFVGAVSAHNPGQSYLYVRVYEDRLEGRFEATFKDLNKALNLKLERGKGIKQVEPHLDEIQAYMEKRSGFSSKFGKHPIKFIEPSLLEIPQLGDYLQVNFQFENIKETPKELDLEYKLFFDEDSSHRALVLIEYNWKDGVHGNESIHSLVVGPSTTKQTLALSKGGSLLSGFLGMIRLGIWHIWIGFDHILFLLALALPSVLLLMSDRNDGDSTERVFAGRWIPAPEFKSAFIKIIKVVTAFTLAHTITLSLAALNIFNLPGRFVESIIALSIALAAIHNIWPVGIKKEWVIAFAFGLFHGFGFAGVLAEKGFGGEYMVLTLLGFNLGVEIGQVAIIAVMFPLLYIVRKYSWYGYLLVLGSAALIFASLYWFVERAFEIDLPLGGIILRALGLL